MLRRSRAGRCSIVIAIVILTASAASQAQIVNGTATLDHAAVGALLASENGSPATIRCSGTMIACSTFLTANHCVDGNPAESFQVYLQSEGILPVTAISAPPAFPDGTPADLALLTLGNSIEATRPLPLSNSVNGGDGSAGQIVGFGVTAPKVSDHGIKRVGRIETRECTQDNTGRICWEYDGSMSTTCNIDSGGPLLFSDPANRTVVGGVTMGGNVQCGTVSEYIDTDVGFFQDWILDEAGTDLPAISCGSPSLTLASNLGFPGGARILSPGQHEEHFYVIPNATTEIQASLNGQDDQDLDFDLDVLIHKADWSVSDHCSGESDRRFESCRLNVSTDDAIVGVSVAMTGDYDGSYQLVVTAMHTE